MLISCILTKGKKMSVVRVVFKYFDITKTVTSWVNALIGTPNDLPRPKSAIFINPFESINKFWGFKSL